MVLGLATGGTLMAGKLLPFLLKAGSASKLPLLLRTAGVLGGAAPGIAKGDLGAALVGGGIGGLSTVGFGGPVRGVAQAAKGAIKGQMLPQALGQGLRIGAGVGIPAAAGLGIGRLAGGGLSGGAGNVGRAGVSLGGYGTVGGEGMAAGGAPIPPGITPYGYASPIGDPLSVINPLGLDAGRRLRSVKDAQTLRDAMNITLPTVRKFAEQAKRDEFARDMTGAGIKQNILTNAVLTENMQKAALNMGQTASEQAGQALTARYNY
tara:strand:+ start:301 stop:1092 length:792 start_codon:yes stop_codon:yes gene_type:complete